MTGLMVSAVGLALLLVSIEAARTNQARGKFHLGLANALLAGAAAAVVGLPYFPDADPLACAGGLAAAVLVRVLVDRRICPRHLSPWSNPERWRYPP